MIRIALVLMSFLTYIFADLPPVKTYKTIDECQSDIYFGNGIMTTFSEADNALYSTLIPAILHDIYDDNATRMNRMHHFDVAYNYSFKKDLGVVGGVLDLAETYEQLKNTSIGWESIQYIIDAINLLVSKRKPWGRSGKKGVDDF